MNLGVLKGVNCLLDDNSIIELNLPHESIRAMDMYLYVLQRSSFMEQLFEIYRDCSKKNFGTTLLPITVGYPKWY